LDYWR